jgi:phage-related protein
MQDFWDWVSSNAVSVWHTVQSAAVDAWGVVSGAIKTAWSTITSVIARGVDMAIGAASTLWGWLRTAGAWLSDNFGAGFMKVWDALSKAVSDVVSEIMPTLEALWSYIQWGWEHVVGPALRLMGTAWQEHVKLFVTLLMAVVMPTLTALWDGFKLVFLMVTTAAKIFWENIKLTFNLIWIHIKTVFSIIKSVIEIGVGIILAIWENFGPIILNSVKATWTFITDTISAAIKLVSNVIQLVMNIIQGDWSEAWENVKNILNAAWELVWAAIKFFGSLILTYFRDLPGKIVSFIGDVGRLLWNKGSDIINSLWNGIKAIWEKVRTWFLGSGGRGGVKNAIVNFFSNAKDWLISAGKNIINGIKTGITNAIDAIGNFFSNIKDKIVQGFKDAFNIGSPSKVMMGVGRDIIWGLIEGAWTKVKDIPKLVRSIGLSFMDIVKIVGEGAWGALGSIGDALGIDSLVDMFSGGGGGGGSSGVQKLAQQMASMYGWIGAQWDALKALVQGESGWNPNAQNPTSTAYGLFQFLNSTWAGVGATKTSDPAGQIQAGLEYIRQRYGTPLDAYRAWLSRSPHWYEKGAWNLLTDQLAFLHKGEMVVPSPVARVLRSTADMGPPRGSAGATFNFHGPVSFGSERATDDFDFWTRTKLSGV